MKLAAIVLTGDFTDPPPVLKGEDESCISGRVCECEPGKTGPPLEHETVCCMIPLLNAVCCHKSLDGPVRTFHEVIDAVIVIPLKVEHLAEHTVLISSDLCKLIVAEGPRTRAPEKGRLYGSLE